MTVPITTPRASDCVPPVAIGRVGVDDYDEKDVVRTRDSRCRYRGVRERIDDCRLPTVVVLLEHGRRRRRRLRCCCCRRRRRRPRFADRDAPDRDNVRWIYVGDDVCPVHVDAVDVRKLGVHQQKEAVTDEDAEYKEDLPPAARTSTHRC